MTMLCISLSRLHTISPLTLICDAGPLPSQTFQDTTKLILSKQFADSGVQSEQLTSHLRHRTCQTETEEDTAVET